MTKQTISAIVNDVPGVLQRIAGLFGRRGYNIESITVGASEEAGLSRVIIVTRGDDRLIAQMCHQLSKLIDVIDVSHLSAGPLVSRELMLVKLFVAPDRRPEIFDIVQTFRCSVVDVGIDSIMIQAVGDTDKNNAFVQLLQSYGVLELTRTGETAMSRG